jgi:hypothetical protein
VLLGRNRLVLHLLRELAAQRALDVARRHELNSIVRADTVKSSRTHGVREGFISCYSQHCIEQLPFITNWHQYTSRTIVQDFAVRRNVVGDAR